MPRIRHQPAPAGQRPRDIEDMVKKGILNPAGSGPGIPLPSVPETAHEGLDGAGEREWLINGSNGSYLLGISDPARSFGFVGPSHAWKEQIRSSSQISSVAYSPK